MDAKSRNGQFPRTLHDAGWYDNREWEDNKLTNPEKVALWTLLGSKERATLKKIGAARKAKPKETENDV